tara:strand:- start:125 stop:664 length:540 start_codon:yes stop_codon:yes gene_type:complete
MKNIYIISVLSLLLFSCDNSSTESNDPVVIGSFKNDAGKDVPIILGEVTNQQIWLDYIKAHNDKDLNKIAEINAENWEGYTADGSVVKGNEAHIEILDNWFKNASPRWEVRWMIANSTENENGELEQWLTTGNEYYDVDPEGNDIFEYNVHDVQFKDGKIVRINVYSREKEQDSKEFSY